MSVQVKLVFAAELPFGKALFGVPSIMKQGVW
jgi:hypothetical protein